jgi:hypothetical protein
LFGLRLKWQYATGLETDLGIDMWKTINVAFKPACDIRELLGHKGAQFYPPEKWMHEPEDRSQRLEIWPPLEDDVNISADQGSRKLFNGRQWPKRGDFYDRVKELLYPNENGFRGFARLETRDGQPSPRVTYSRPFFEQLDMVVQYWDTSLDEYIPQKSKGADTSTEILSQLDGQDEPRKKTKLSEDSREEKEQDDSHLPSEIIPEDVPLSPESPTIVTMNRYSRFSRIGKGRNNSPPPTGTYRGWRIETGRRMPSATRDQIVKVFVELAIWPFSLHVDNFERSAPRLSMQTLRVTVPLSKRVWRDPITREDARKGIVSGPGLGISSRHMHSFAENRFNSDLDLLRELGAILLVAQERTREGRQEKMVGEGVWWNEKPRFAGMPYEVPGEYKAEQAAEKKEDDGDNASEKEHENGKKKKERERERERDRGFGASKRKTKEALPSDMTIRQRAIHAYKLNTPPLPIWDAKAVYRRVGKDPESDYDEVCELDRHLENYMLTRYLGIPDLICKPPY